MNLKVYGCNYDGRVERIVAAKSMRQAALLTNIPYHHFREYGHETHNSESCALALSTPGTVYEGPCTSNKWHALEKKE